MVTPRSSGSGTVQDDTDTVIVGGLRSRTRRSALAGAVWAAVTNYAALHAWSVKDLAAFWWSIWEYCQIRAHTPPTTTSWSISAHPPRRGGATCARSHSPPSLAAILVAGVEEELAGVEAAELADRRDAVRTTLLAAKARSPLP